MCTVWRHLKELTLYQQTPEARPGTGQLGLLDNKLTIIVFLCNLILVQKLLESSVPYYLLVSIAQALIGEMFAHDSQTFQIN